MGHIEYSAKTWVIPANVNTNIRSELATLFAILSTQPRSNTLLDWAVDRSPAPGSSLSEGWRGGNTCLSERRHRAVR